MALQVRDHVPAVTAVATVASLALVFGAALGGIPASLLPRAPDSIVAAIPHANAVISVVAFAVVAHGWRTIRQGRVARHRASMLSGLGLFATFLVLYLYRIVVAGTTSFTGPAVLEQFVYLPVLVVHVGLAIVCIPLLYYVLLLALTRPRGELSESMHPTVGRVAASLWLTSFGLGVVVYLLLYAL